jgi:hypothetical protein
MTIMGTQVAGHKVVLTCPGKFVNLRHKTATDRLEGAHGRGPLYFGDHRNVLVNQARSKRQEPVTNRLFGD